MAEKLPDARALFERHYLEMRARCLALAADLDRIDRAAGGEQMQTDARVEKLRRGIGVLLEKRPDRAERVQMIFSDTTPVQR
ncbi:MAG: hypothetical protein M3O30_06825 [Planctomycetota bacterium]|nr:hypothetical protein [Planctomycetota bacterium]